MARSLGERALKFFGMRRCSTGSTGTGKSAERQLLDLPLPMVSTSGRRSRRRRELQAGVEDDGQAGAASAGTRMMSPGLSASSERSACVLRRRAALA